MNHPDILIIGGGVIGLTTAYHCARKGAKVCLLDRQQLGREASSAGAGMLPPGNLRCATTPKGRLRGLSYDLWDAFSLELKSRTGIDNGYRRCGSIRVSHSCALVAEQTRRWRDEGIAFEELCRSDLENYVPHLHSEFERGIFLPNYSQVTSQEHLKALEAACRQVNVEIFEHATELVLKCSRGRVAATTKNREFSTHRVCVTAGSWSHEILAPLGVAIPVEPVRGQIVELRVKEKHFSCMVELDQRYLVPRTDESVLVGSTEERVGFRKHTTVEGVTGLLDFAKSLVPDLARAEVLRCWAGLRPGSPHGLPLLGRVPGFENLFVGAGHSRSGMQMSTGTGHILSDLLLDRTPEIDIGGLTYDSHLDL